MVDSTESIERAVFPRTSLEAASLNNSLLTHQTAFRATVMNEERRFTLSTPTSVLDPSGLILRCKVGDCDALISLNDDQLHDLLPGLAADIVINELPDALIMAVAETALRPVLAGFAAFLNLPFSIERRENNAPTDWLSAMVYEVTDDNCAPVAVFCVSPDGLNVLTRALDAAPTANAWNETESIPVKIEARFWRTAMGAADLTRLSCGDVVLLPQDYPPDQVTLVASDMQAVLGTGRRNGSAITVEELKGTTHDRP